MAVASPSSAPDKSRFQQAWLNQLARRGGAALRLGMILPLGASALLVVQAWLLAHILHLAIVDHANVSNLWPLVAGLALLLILRAAISALGDVLATRGAERIMTALRARIFAVVLGHQPTWTAARPSGALSAAVIEQIDALDGYLTRYLPAMVQAGVVPLAFAATMAPVDWTVALLFLFTAPLIPLFMALAGWGAEAASRRQASALSRLGGHFADRLRGLTTLMLFGRAAAETEGVALASDELRRRTMRVMRIAFLSSAVLEFFAALGVAGVALYVGLSFLGLVSLRPTPLALEAGLFCLLMAPEVYNPLRLLAAHYHDRAAAKAAVAEIEQQLDGLPQHEASPVQVTGFSPLKAPIGLALERVKISTPTGRRVIDGADLTIAPGEHIALLGPSGSGKSTLLEAIAGLRSYGGRIVLEGQELDEIDVRALRGAVGVLGQRPKLFAGSIGDNIRLGRRDACETAVRIAADRARVLDFAGSLPVGLDTLLGEDGVGLSGGEIHRIALARLYLRDPMLMLLDEPTAHLDLLTEERVLDRLLDFARGRTLIVATHSNAVAARMDRCFRVAEGHLLPSPKPRREISDLRGAA